MNAYIFFVIEFSQDIRSEDSQVQKSNFYESD